MYIMYIYIKFKLIFVTVTFDRRALKPPLGGEGVVLVDPMREKKGDGMSRGMRHGTWGPLRGASNHDMLYTNDHMCIKDNDYL